MKRLYKATELAKILQVSPKTIYKLGELGEIESYKIGKSVRFPMPEIRKDKTNDTEGKNNTLSE